ncbi:MAG: NAD(P)-binding domain-containing protein [Candidatus Paceibacterota bacterium]|jgi:nucleotide sugar dehydrogenase|nr:NAD(P)-binding domain-containing protein [Candidatus Paceibacterota bacterium]
MKNTKKPTIGFIGQGWIGKNYADNFEERGYKVVRYAKEEPYTKNKDKIAKCDIVFIAVPTPSTPKGFDDSILRKVLPLVGKGKIVVLKSTLLPGTTAKLQKKFPDIILMHSPEFLREVSAKFDTANPDRNIVGIPVDNKKYRTAAEKALSVMPKAPFEKVCTAEEAELVKYGGNCWLYVKVVFVNMLHDLSQQIPNVKYETVRDAMKADPRIGDSHLDPVHKSGRGAGGHCFIKDFAAFANLYEKLLDDPRGTEALRSFEKKNNHLLKTSGKDLDLLRGVYGDDI